MADSNYELRHKRQKLSENEKEQKRLKTAERIRSAKEKRMEQDKKWELLMESSHRHVDAGIEHSMNSHHVQMGIATSKLYNELGYSGRSREDNRNQGVCIHEIEEPIKETMKTTPQLRLSNGLAGATAKLYKDLGYLDDHPEKNINQNDRIREIEGPSISETVETTLSGPSGDNDLSTEVRDFLEANGLEKLIQLFTVEKINWESLLSLNEDDVARWGVPFGSRRKLMEAITNMDTPLSRNFYKHGLQEFIPKFIAHDITMNDLKYLKDRDLEDMGMHFGDRMNLRRLISSYSSSFIS